jgi:membrane protein DedA with SNARE-associated domain
LALGLATSTADKPTTLALLFVAQALSWAGVPALGAAAMAVAGGLASQGVVRLWAVLVVGTFGAETGSLAGWWVGKRLAGAGSDRKGPLATRKRRALLAGRRFASRWGRLMVFFVPSWVSGGLGMPLRQFAFWNLLAAAAWNVGAGLSAYGVGFAISGRPAVATVTTIAIGLAALLAMTVVFVRRRRLPQ